MDRERITQKIRKLLELSASDNEHEAAAAVAKAQALLSEHNLSMSDIPESDGQCARATKAQARTRQNLESWAHYLARTTAEAFDCAYFHCSSGHTFFVGVGSDQEICAWMFLYLYKRLLRSGSAYLKQPHCKRLRTNKSKGAARDSYLKGAVFIIEQRLKKQKELTPVTGFALVPVKKNAINAAMPGNLRIRERKNNPMRCDDMFNGMKDGRHIPLSTPLATNQRQELQ